MTILDDDKGIRCREGLTSVIGKVLSLLLKDSQVIGNSKVYLSSCYGTSVYYIGPLCLRED